MCGLPIAPSPAYLAQALHGRVDARRPYPLDDALVARLARPPEALDRVAQLPLDPLEPEAEEVKLPRLECYLYLDAADEAQAGPGRGGLGLGKAGQGVVIGQGEGHEAALEGEGYELGRGKAPVARSRMGMEVDQGRPARASSPEQPKARTGTEARESRRQASSARRSSSRGSVPISGEGRALV